MILVPFFQNDTLITIFVIYITLQSSIQKCYKLQILCISVLLYSTAEMPLQLQQLISVFFPG